MESIAYIILIVFFIVAINMYFVVLRLRSGNRRSKKNRVAPEEAEQKKWRDQEVIRRIEREQDGAYERVKLRNETLALYDEVRKRAETRESEGAIISSSEWESIDADDVERFR